jgi:hypothetical protein
VLVFFHNNQSSYKAAGGGIAARVKPVKISQPNRPYSGPSANLTFALWAGRNAVNGLLSLSRNSQADIIDHHGQAAPGTFVPGGPWRFYSVDRLKLRLIGVDPEVVKD